MPDEATNAPVPGDFTADESPLAEELDTTTTDSTAADSAAADDATADDVAPGAEAGADADEVVPDEANASMDPPTENLADELAAGQESGTEVSEDAVTEQPATDEAPEAVADEANDSMNPATVNIADELAGTDQPAPADQPAAEQAAEQPARPRRRRAASRPAGPPVEVAAPVEVPVTTIAAVASPADETPVASPEPVVVERPRRKRATRAAGAAAPVVTTPVAQQATQDTEASSTEAPVDTAPASQDAAGEKPARKSKSKKDKDGKAKGEKGSKKRERSDDASDANGSAKESTEAAPKGEPTVFPDGAVITQRQPSRRRRRGAEVVADDANAPQADVQQDTAPVEAAASDSNAPDTNTHDDNASASSESGTNETGSNGTGSNESERGTRSRRRRAGRRQGAPEASEQDGTTDDVAAAVAQRVADAAPAGRAGGEVAADERDRKLQDLVAALAGVGEDPTGEDADDEDEQDTTAQDVPEGDEAEDAGTEQQDDADDSDDESGDSERGTRRRRRRRGGRRRRRGGESDEQDSEDDSDEQDAEGDEPASGQDDESDDQASDDDTEDSADDGTEGEQGDGSRRRRRRRRRRGEDTSGAEDDPTEVVVRVREPRSAKQVNDEVTGIEGSTRMEAKRQRRKEGRAAGRSRRPILSEAEFLSRREAVNRKLLIRQRDDYTQLAVLEDDVLVEHYVDRASATSLIGNIYMGRVQNVLPSMEAVFIDIGRGRNAVLYAGEVDWDSYGAVGGSKKVEQVFKSGQTVLVQVTKDPVGAKGARLTNHISLPGRYVVYSPGGHLSGISRKLADTERHRLRDILGDLVSDDESVIVRTAAEGASEEELVRDVNRLKAQWEAIQKKVKQGSAPQLLYAEPDLTVRIVRDLFTEDFDELVVQGNGSAEDAFDSIEAYVSHVAPHLHERVKRHDPEGGADLFSKYRIDEQIAKALERKVFLPSGGSLVIDRTEAMTVIDVNTGKFTGSGGNLEATVTSNNLEAAEEIVRQLRLRDIGGIIVVDFIDMVLPSNRELLLRRLVECLGRDRTRHQVAEVTSLGLVQMTRKKIGTGLAEAFTEPCDCCGGRGYMRHDEPVESQAPADGGERRSGTSTSRRGGRRRSSKGDSN